MKLAGVRVLFSREGLYKAVFPLVAALAVAAVCLAGVGGRGAAAATELREVQVGCEIFKIAREDPMFHTEHLHPMWGDTSGGGESTVESLHEADGTSCATPGYEPLDWTAAARDGAETEMVPIRNVNMYYRGVGDEIPWPFGTHLLANKANGKVSFMCGTQGEQVETPPYGCKAEQWRMRITFPDCWNGLNEREPANFKYDGVGDCPAQFPHKMVETRMTIHYENTGGLFQGPLTISAGADEWRDYTFAHGNIIFVPKTQFYTLMDDCGVTEPLEGPMPPECRTGNPSDLDFDTKAPVLSGKSPTGRKVSPRASVVATFDEPMMKSSLNEATVKLIKKGTTNAVAATLSYPAPNKVILNPTRSLTRRATYTVTIVGGASGAKDLAGNALAASVGWSFKVRA